jgi:hypothetical protein
MANNPSLPSLLSRSTGQLKDDTASEYSNGPDESVVPAQVVTPYTPLRPKCKASVYAIPFALPFPVGGVDEYAHRDLTVEKRYSLESKPTLDSDETCFSSEAVERNNFSSDVVGENDMRLCTPKRNRDTSTTSLLLEQTSVDDDSFEKELDDMDLSQEWRDSLTLPDDRQVVRKKKRKKNDDHNDDSPTPEEKIYVSGYTDTDVLCGRGESVNRHPGNVAFHEEKRRLQPSYLQTQVRKKKTAIAEELVSVMRCDYGARFLAQDETNHQWYFLEEERTVEKAKQVLREYFTPEKRRAKRERHAQRNPANN